MDSLPDEILLVIFSFVKDPKTVLNYLPFVCKKWQSLCKKSFTGILDFSIYEDFDLNLSTDLALVLRNRFKYIHTLRIDCDALQNSTIVDLSKCSKLYKLSLSHTSIDCNTLTEIMKNKSIRKLNLHCCTKIKTEFLFTLCNLEYLNLSMSRANDIVIYNIANYCPKLKYLDISYSPKVYNQSLLFLIQKCKNLKILNITGCTNLSFSSNNFKNISKIYYLGTKIK